MSTDLFFANFTQKIARRPQTYTLPNSDKKYQDIDRLIHCQIQTKNSKTLTDLYVAKFRQKIARHRQTYTLPISDKI